MRRYPIGRYVSVITVAEKAFPVPGQQLLHQSRVGRSRRSDAGRRQAQECQPRLTQQLAAQRVQCVQRLLSVANLTVKQQIVVERVDFRRALLHVIRVLLVFLIVSSSPRQRNCCSGGGFIHHCVDQFVQQDLGHSR